MIHFVVALPSEARPLLDALALEPVEGRETIEAHGQHVEPRLYLGAESRLVITGVGREASRRGVRRLDELARQVAGETPGPAVGSAPSPWLNVGLACHRDLPIGSAVVAHQVVERRGGATWFPSLVVEPPVPTATVVTVDRAVRRPDGGEIFEMEASGFYRAAVRCAPAELVGVFKIVSDHGIETDAWLTREEIGELVAARLPEIRAYAADLLELRSTRYPKEELSSVEPLLERWHFTVTQRRQLDREARRAAALGKTLAGLVEGGEPDARSVLRSIRSILDRASEEAPLPPAPLGLGGPR